MKKSTLFTLVITTLLLLGACKKNKTQPSPTPVANGNRAELTADSIFLYAKQVYLWNNALPSYEVFKPRNYTSSSSTDIYAMNDELFEITRFGIDPTTGKPFEYNPNNNNVPKYSYIFNSSDKNPTGYIHTQKSAVDLEGYGNDLGAKIGIYDRNGNSYKIYVQAVYQNSPADKAGLVRGDEITKMNDTNIGTNINEELMLINSIFSASNLKISGIKANGTPFTYDLQKASYQSSPIYKDKIFVSGSKKIGYMAYARFSTMENSQRYFDEIFTKFSNENISDLIIDLRYNGGGYINTAEYLINLIAPTSTNGKTMFYEYYNKTMQDGKASILMNQPLLDNNLKVQYNQGKIVTYADVDYSTKGNTIIIKKTKGLSQVKNIVFIVSHGTASASELIINSLKPHVNVKLVGQTTYGKPVGFFPITIENKYDVYYSMFETKNSNGEGGYYAGMKPDVEDDFDDAKHNFGDAEENYTKKALNILAPGINGFSNIKPLSKIMSINPASNSYQSAPQLSNGSEFVGMIKTKYNLK
ncbi:MAG: PDZ domain-containing protein [Sphingobacteriaceae bacterium]|nr:PDZ domain-containing protein [Sphingobacteriaceae bacterium]